VNDSGTFDTTYYHDDRDRGEPNNRRAPRSVTI
jgi:hypothetical protein